MKNLFLFLFFIYSIHVNSQTLTYNPDPWLPDTIFLKLGNTIEIYNDNIAYVKLNDSLLKFKWHIEVGDTNNMGWFWTADKLGEFNLKFYCLVNGETIDSTHTLLKVVDTSYRNSINLLTIGNSLVENGYNFQFQQILKDISFPLQAIGTRGSPYLHEGHGGWTWHSFLSSKSPFYISDKINFKAYINANSLNNPDIIRISLGINDCYGGEAIENIINNSELLIDTIRHDYPNSLLIIALPTLCENSGYGWIANYSSLNNYEQYQLRMRELWKRLYDKYSYGKYNRNVQVSFDGLFIDRDNGYPKKNGIHSNGVHPAPLGYTQLSRGFSNALNYYQNKIFITNINPKVE